MPSFEAKAVACHRGKHYDAEVMFTIYINLDNHECVQHKISGGHTTRDDAIAAANKIVDEINARMKSTAKTILTKYPEAKP